MTVAQCSLHNVKASAQWEKSGLEMKWIAALILDHDLFPSQQQFYTGPSADVNPDGIEDWVFTCERIDIAFDGNIPQVTTEKTMSCVAWELCTA